MDDDLTAAQVGDSEARYREFSRKGQMPAKDYADHMTKVRNASFKADWGMLVLFMCGTILLGWAIGGLTIWFVGWQ